MGAPARPRGKAAAATAALERYRDKRRFDATPEPAGQSQTRGDARSPAQFVIQRHDARKLHYDFRLEVDGVLKSWAVPKGPCEDPAVKRLAVEVEDHPLDYAGFEGTIPAGNYGAGEVRIWDRGHWWPEGDAAAGLAAGKLKFRLDGERLRGDWVLVRSGGARSAKKQWLLMKARDAAAQPLPAAPEDVGASRRAARTGRRPASQAGASAASKAVASPAPTSAASTVAPVLTSSASAQATPLPDWIAPQLATLVDAPPTAGTWRYELKLDGYRVLAHLSGGGKRRAPKVRLLTRTGQDWTERYPAAVRALRTLRIGDSWLDGEAVALDARGVPDFQALQRAFEVGTDQDVVLYVFDAPFLDGVDLREETLDRRRAALEAALPDALRADGAVRFSAELDLAPQALLPEACRLGMEGLIGKRADSLYRGGRMPDWIKLKCRRRQEFVLGGYTAPKGRRGGFGALLLGVYDPPALDDRPPGPLRYAGRVGTGFDQGLIDTVLQALQPLRAAHSPFAGKVALRGDSVQWLAPQCVAEVSFAEWTRDGMVRQASFVALRADKPAVEIGREQAQHEAGERPAKRSAEAARKDAGSLNPGTARGRRAAAAGAAPAAPRTARRDAAEVEGIVVSHAQRVIDAVSGATKLDVVRYYASAAPAMMPYLDDRPLALLRAPEGVGGETFFQKHAGRGGITGMRELDAALDPGHPALLCAAEPMALVGAAQMGALEFHTWGARAAAIERPDRMVFDLDPGEGLDWRTVVEDARLVRAVLEELDLPVFCKTSGGKGLHLVVPLTRHHDWDRVSGFSQAVSAHLAATLPERFTARMGAKHRVGRLFVDALRNKRGASTVAPFSLRARPGLGVSVPVAWEELDELSGGDHWRIDTVGPRLHGGHAPWRAFAQSARRLTQAMRERLDTKPGR